MIELHATNILETFGGWTVRTSRLERGGWAGEVDLGKAGRPKEIRRKQRTCQHWPSKFEGARDERFPGGTRDEHF